MLPKLCFICLFYLLITVSIFLHDLSSFPFAIDVPMFSVAICCHSALHGAVKSQTKCSGADFSSPPLEARATEPRNVAAKCHSDKMSVPTYKIYQILCVALKIYICIYYIIRICIYNRVYIYMTIERHTYVIIDMCVRTIP